MEDDACPSTPRQSKVHGAGNLILHLFYIQSNSRINMNTNLAKLNLIIILSCMWSVTETQKQTDFCGTRKPVLSVCNDGELYYKTSVFIDTGRTKSFQKSCSCTISSARNATPLDIEYTDISNRSSIRNFQFRINDVVLNRSVTSGQTTFTGEIKLVFTRRHFKKGGVCLQIKTGGQLSSSADDPSILNVTCAGQTAPEPADYGTSNSHAVPIVLSVTGALLLISGVVIAHLVVKRYRMAQKARNGGDQAPSSSEHATNQGRHTYASGIDHYLTMSDNICKTNKHEKYRGYRSPVEESYELAGACNSRFGGQSQLSSRSNIYESMHAPVESRSYSKAFENSR